MQAIVPISTHDQSSRNEENVQTSITKRNLHHLPKSVAQGFQEVLVETFSVAGLMEGRTNSPEQGHRWDLILTERNQDGFGDLLLGEYK